MNVALTAGSEKDQDEDDDPATHAELAERLVNVITHLREEGLFNLEQFLIAAEREMGGTLVLQCPSRFKKRAVPEARFAGEGFMGSLGA